MSSQEAVEPNRKLAALTTLAMLTTCAALAVLAVLLLGTLGRAAAQPSAPSAPSASATDPSWTATTRPEEVIAARKALMLEAGLVMIPVDAFAAAEPADAAAARSAADLHRAAESVERLLLALPHLFPPPTNLFDENDELPATAALPAIWQNFAQFYAANEAAIQAAQALAAATGAAELSAAATALRGSCDGCHALYLKAYTPPVATDADRDIDFDSLFQ